MVDFLVGRMPRISEMLPRLPTEVKDKRTVAKGGRFAANGDQKITCQAFEKGLGMKTSVTNHSVDCGLELMDGRRPCEDG